RQSQMQDILYRRAEVFAPFNVEVLQLKGDGNHPTTGGATTIFVGTFSAGDAFTPNAFMDYPHGDNNSHGFNTDAYDIAFVDESWNAVSSSLLPDVRIAAAVAHEAGHTFGLAHVRTDGNSDYPNNPIDTSIEFKSGLPPDVMSYDSNNDFFSNTAYTLTEVNGDGLDPDLSPNYKGTALLTQNSFTYLQAVLGARPTTSRVGAIDENVSLDYASFSGTLNLVDPGYYNQSN